MTFPSRSQTAPPGGLSPRPILVLVVDDDPSVRRYAARILEEAGYIVFQAKDGLDALALVQANPGRLDAVVSDIVMPKLDGIELTARLSLADPELPVVLMSAYGTQQLDERGITAPCGVLQKPFPPEHLVAEVERCVRTRS